MNDNITKIKNPVLPGFYPDPSICRVGADFYMVTSSFSYYPGVPIFHSKDLVQWEQIGHVLDRPEQLILNPNDLSAGIFAPTIRWHEGIFYLVTTNITTFENFIVTAENPAGPWSVPQVIKGCGGIDPSLFWDDDGRVFLTRTADFTDPGPSMITINEIDPGTFQLIGEKKRIWGGALKNCKSPEAPHIYKKDNWYYLLIAEGGTEHYHAVTIARSKTVDGGYEGYNGNPIITHRNLGIEYPISNVGHGDLAELADGSWYMVLLGSRPYGGYHKNMGRETFIVPVIWENGWPVVSPGSGKVEWEYPAPPLASSSGKAAKQQEEYDDFDNQELAYIWNFIGIPENKVFNIADSCLKLRTIAASIGGSDKEKPDFANMGKGSVKKEALAFVGRRQQHMSFRVETRMEFEPVHHGAAGLVIVQNNYHQLRIELCLNEAGQKVVRVIRGYTSLTAELEHKWEEAGYQEEILQEMLWEGTQVSLNMIANLQEYFLWAESPDGMKRMPAVSVDGSFLGSETAGGFVGAYIGMFATGNGEEIDSAASFDWFRYQPQNID